MTSLIKLFNSQFLEFLSDILIVFPNDLNIKTAKFYVEKIIKMNPSLPIKTWYDDVVVPYKGQIEAGNFDFFLNKEYDEDINSDENEGVLETISILKKKASQLGEGEKNKIIKYAQNLCKISLMYKQ